MPPIDNLLDTILRLSVAALAGAAVGWDRERRDKPAGLRTHMLVALGSALFVLAGLRLGATIESANPGSLVQLDPYRLLQGIIGGIGFLGAGTIIQSGGAVEGVTTAASVWVVAGMGIAAALGYYDLVAITVLLVLFVLILIGWLKRRLDPDSPTDADD